MNQTESCMAWRSRTEQGLRAISGAGGMKRVALVFCLATGLLSGCGKSTSGLASHDDYAYAADTTEQVAKARARFDAVVRLFQSAGLRSTSSSQSDQRNEAVITGSGTEARIALDFPGNGFATIKL
jgi:hypothetical protein